MPNAMLGKICASSYRGVKGIICKDSGISGPVAAILACTHGNEPAGLAAIEYLIDELRLEKGRLLFILVNPEAARQGRRYIDKNMNRLPHDPMDWAGTGEGERLAQLLPVLNEVDSGVLDIHSTSAPSPTLLLSVDERGYEVANCPSLPFQHIVSGITRFIDARFIIETCLHAPLKLLAECGQHQNPEASRLAVEMSLAFLRKLEMVEPLCGEAAVKTKQCFRVIEAVHLPKDGRDFRLLKPIGCFEWLEKGQKIACNGAEQICAPVGGYAIMCPETEEALDCSEALLFLCEKRN